MARPPRQARATAGIALVATAATVAGFLTATISPAFADGVTTTTAATTTTTTPTFNFSAPSSDANPTWSDSLADIQARAAEAISDRLGSLSTAIKDVQGFTFLGSDGTTLVSEMQADISGLQALAGKIAGDTTVQQAIIDSDVIFNGYGLGEDRFVAVRCLERRLKCG